MTWTSDTRDINFILNRFDDVLDRVWADCQILREMTTAEESVAICDIETSIEGYRQYTKTYIEAVDKTKEQNEILKTENKILKAQLDVLNAQIRERFNTMDELINLVNDNAKAVAFSKYTKDKTDKTGINSPRYRKDIDDEQLVKDYQQGATLKELAEKYKISSPGLMNRLKYLGVYKPTYNKEQ